MRTSFNPNKRLLTVTLTMPEYADMKMNIVKNGVSLKEAPYFLVDREAAALRREYGRCEVEVRLEEPSCG